MSPKRAQKRQPPYPKYVEKASKDCITTCGTLPWRGGRGDKGPYWTRTNRWELATVGSMPVANGTPPPDLPTSLPSQLWTLCLRMAPSLASSYHGLAVSVQKLFFTLSKTCLSVLWNITVQGSVCLCVCVHVCVYVCTCACVLKAYRALTALISYLWIPVKWLKSIAVQTHEWTEELPLPSSFFLSWMLCTWYSLMSMWLGGMCFELFYKGKTVEKVSSWWQVCHNGHTVLDLKKNISFAYISLTSK